MIKYVEEDTLVAFSEIPDEITLCVNISNCQNNCKGCHSPYLAQDIGGELNEEAIDELIKKNDGITCFSFMGEGNDRDRIIELANYIKEKYPKLKRAIYSGREVMDERYPAIFDYVKIGPYKEEFGPLNKETTNQRMIMFNHSHSDEPIITSSWFCQDITDKFWNKGKL